MRTPPVSGAGTDSFGGVHRHTVPQPRPVGPALGDEGELVASGSGQCHLEFEQLNSGAEDPDTPLTPEQIFSFATVGGARNANLADKVGTLTPGKERTSCCYVPPTSTPGPAPTCSPGWSASPPPATSTPSSSAVRSANGPAASSGTT
ncbi:MAG: hypothetical protein EOO27_22785 [Comamonadaceae bacterium]|nr:MAG: hypothetical protein EOO27_22785 [Comamonadaceae bacterium]